MPAPHPAAGANPNSVANQNIEHLKSAIKGIKNIKQELRDVQKVGKVPKDILYSKLKLQKAELWSMQRWMRYLEKLRGLGGQPQSMGSGTENEPHGAGTDSTQLPSVEQVTKICHWQGKKEIKNIVALMLKKLMNITALDAMKLPLADKQLIWFNWAMTEDGNHNHNALEMVWK
ncbi:hypothetical protein BD413DRAFT_599893 [Trametes elegans]|nr:hypothetical protein BD413DRAFT_599893 [Trametes elegans]